MTRVSFALLAAWLAVAAVALPIGEDENPTTPPQNTTHEPSINSCKSVLPPKVDPLLRSGYTDPWRRWPNNEVPYVLSSEFTADQKATIVRGFDVFGKWTCVKFVPRNGQTDYLLVQSDPTGGCWAVVGYAHASPQHMNLQPNGCVYEGHAFHEAMHTVGFFHEQNRHDRDYSIIYNLDLVGDGHEKRYDFSSWGVPYNYNSAMHYGQSMINGKPLFTATRDMKGIDFGSPTVFAWSDVRRVNRMYNCDPSYEQAIDLQEYGKA